jgi:hypothetical protein
MPWYVQLPVVFVYTAVVWVAVLLLYSFFFEAFDFGPLGWFALKSALLVLVASLIVIFIPFGICGLVLVWWLGLMVIFKKDFWECRVLVILIWGVDFLLYMMIQGLIMSAGQSPVSTV